MHQVHDGDAKNKRLHTAFFLQTHTVACFSRGDDRSKKTREMQPLRAGMYACQTINTLIDLYPMLSITCKVRINYHNVNILNRVNASLFHTVNHFTN